MIQFKADKTPLYLQIKHYIEKNISEEKWGVGYKLPPERELARELEVSRKTVSLAYKELQREGILSSHQGRGTFVIKKPLKEKNGILEIIKAIDSCIEKALDLEIGLNDFLELCKNRVNEYINQLHKLELVFIECNREQLDYFSKELELGSGISIIPVLLQDFKRNVEEFNQKLKSSDFVVTTFFHVDEVKSLIKNKEIEILPIALNPQLESIIKIARIPKNYSIGILCISQNFADKVKKAISDAGLSFNNIKVCTSTDSDDVKTFVESADAIITSPGRKKDVLCFADGEKNVIEFIFVPDLGSINFLKSAILKKHMK